MRARYERQPEQLRSAVAAASDNVVRLFERTQRGSAAVGRARVHRAQPAADAALCPGIPRAFRPAYIEQIKRMNRQLEQIVRPSLGAQLLGHIGAVDAVARGFARMAEDVSRRLDPVVRPSYFGTLGRASRQINEALRPRYIDSVSRLVEQMQQAVRPYLGQFAVLGRRLQQLARAPLFEALREF